MRRILYNGSLFFAAGCAGGLLNSLAVWAAGKYGLTAAAGVKIAPALALPWLYRRIVWGGIWGFLFFLPAARRNTLARGALLSLGPSAVQLFYLFPYVLGKGFMGLKLGSATPVLVLIFNLVWGISAAYWIRFSRD